MTMLIMVVSLRSSNVDPQPGGRRLLVGIIRGPSRGIPPVLLATPPLHTIRDMLASTPTTMTTVVQGLLWVLARLLVLVELVETTSLTRRISRISELIDFFLLFSPFLCLLLKREKTREVNNFLTLCVPTGASCHIC
jgi:hypothetical protein